MKLKTDVELKYMLRKKPTKISLTTLTIKSKQLIMSFHRKYNSLFKLVDNSMKLYKMYKKKKKEEKKK